MANGLIWLHLLGVVLWVGGMGFGIMALRPSLAAIEPPARIALMGQVHGRFFRIVWGAMPLVLLSGYAMLFGVYGGFAGVRWPIHAMHLIGLIMAGVFVAIWFGPWARMRAAIAAGDIPAASAANNSVRKLVSLNFTLGVITLALGAWGRYGG